MRKEILHGTGIVPRIETMQPFICLPCDSVTIQPLLSLSRHIGCPHCLTNMCFLLWLAYLSFFCISYKLFLSRLCVYDYHILLKYSMIPKFTLKIQHLCFTSFGLAIHNCMKIDYQEDWRSYNWFRYWTEQHKFQSSWWVQNFLYHYSPLMYVD